MLAAGWKGGGEDIRYLPSLLIQKHFVYILQLAVHTVQRNWISRLGRYLMGEADMEFVTGTTGMPV